MDSTYITLTPENLAREHLCCAIADKRHQQGVADKKTWLAARMPQGHVFRKLDARGKVFIEYAPLETAWVPVIGENYLYIYCLWINGEYKGKGYGKMLMEYCLADAKAKGRSGVCMLGAKKQKTWFSDQAFVKKFGFETVDSTLGGYELLALSFDGSRPSFTEAARQQRIDDERLTIFYGKQCPYIPNCLEQVQTYCTDNAIPLQLIPVDSLEKAKNLPCVFNNWATFYKGRFAGVHLLNEGYLKKLLDEPGN